jgi:hypothetical protein
MAGDRDELAHKGMEALQSAAREVIHATRMLLDAAEELVEDPKAVQDFIGGLASVANAAAARIRATGTETAAAAEDDGDDPDDGRVHRIQVS